MKKQFILVALIVVCFGITTKIHAQRKCGTMDYLIQQKADDPSLDLKMQTYEQDPQKWIQNNRTLIKNSKTVITVPVVVHIVYNTSVQNLNDTRVFEQMNVLNRDYAGLNTNSMGAFSTNLKVNTNIQFCLAQRKPDGSPTNGIERRQTSVLSFTVNDAVKYYAQGGLDSWDPTKYFNIWVCNLGGGYTGYSQFPTTGINATFGSVIGYRYFGITGATAPYNLGETATHEVGHCFNLYHTWGDDYGACNGTDYCDDVPNQADHTYGAYTGVLTDLCSSVSPGIMYMDFMDYTDDISLANFTPNQNERIAALFAVNGLLYSLSVSDGCSPSTQCGTPTGLTATNVTSTTATLNWTAVANANSYNIQYRIAGNPTFITTTSATNSKAVTSLTPLSNYEFQVQAVCSVAGSYSSLSSFSTGCADNYESNNTLATAKTIAVNTPISALISTSLDLDYYKFSNSSQQKNIKLTLTNLPADYDLKLYKPNGNLYSTSQFSGMTNETIIYNNAPSGTYILEVYSRSGSYSNFSCYTVTASISGNSFREIAGDNAYAEVKAAMMVYPNPAKDNINIAYSSPNDSPVIVSIYDLTGRKVAENHFEASKGENTYALNTQNLSKGVYAITLENAGARLTSKLIIEK
jgi:hypothetical protein